MTEAGMTDRIEKQMELKAPVARVWRALTDHREFGQWFGVKLDGPFVPGQATTGRITAAGYEHIRLEVQVVQMDAQTLFSYHWHPYAIDASVDYTQEPPTLVEFRLQPSAGGTLLQISESGFDRIPAHRRDEAFRMNGNGWAIQLNNIAAHVTAQH
jgi:uncharacterized protein YndB with AHSA1/START domain